MKGRTENDLLRLPFKAVYAFRPGYIRPAPGLKNSMTVSKVIAPLYPVISRFFPTYVCTVQDLGRAMIRVVNGGHARTILECIDITRRSRDTVP